MQIERVGPGSQILPIGFSLSERSTPMTFGWQILLVKGIGYSSAGAVSIKLASMFLATESGYGSTVIGGLLAMGSGVILFLLNKIWGAVSDKRKRTREKSGEIAKLDKDSATRLAEMSMTERQYLNDQMVRIFELEIKQLNAQIQIRDARITELERRLDRAEQ